MNFKEQLQKKILKTINSQWPQLRTAAVSVSVDYPPDQKFGDYTVNVAMKLAPLLRQSPLEIAEQLKTAAGKIPGVGEVRVVPPGFINFFIDPRWLQRQVEIILKEKQRFGRVDVGKGARVLVEFVSVNPTGPLHVGHGRGAFTGDVLVNVLKLAGYRAYREYYVNDYGNQVNILAESVLRKYWQHHGIRIEFPEYCYQGAYVDELAKTLYLPNYKFSNVQKLEEVRDKIKGRILQKVLGGIRRLLERKLGIRYDRWFSERSLYTTGVVDRMLRLLKERQLLYRSEGALWMKTSQFGDEKDRVVIKANGEPVYFLSDIAYHWDKLVRRKFDTAVDVLGADHHGYIGRLQAAMAAVGTTGKLDIIIAQMVRLLSGGQELKMSKRSGTFVTLEELVDEVGADAARFFFLLYDVNTHMDFDLDLAKKQSKENPVYYVQYAHARICSILGKVSKLPVEKKAPAAPLAVSEATLLKTLLRWPELVAEVSQTYQVHRLPVFATTLATRFHDFYTQCRVIEGGAVNPRRLQLIRVTQVVLQNVLRSMGVSAPAKM